MFKCRSIVILGLLILLGWPAVAVARGERQAVVALLRPPAEGQAASPSDEALAELLAQEQHDPWRLVEYLLARGRQDIAIRLARQASEGATGQLLLYAQSPEASEGSAARERALHAALDAWIAGKHDVALQHIESVRRGAGRPTVFGVTAADMQGEGLVSAGRAVEGVRAWLVGGEEALRLGWWAAADRHFHRALEVAYPASSFDLAARAAEGRRTVAELRGDGETLANCEFNLAAVAQVRGDLPGALRHFDESLSLFQILELAAEVASVRSQRSYVLCELGEFVTAMEEQDALAAYYAGRPHDEAWADNQLSLGLIRFRLGDERGAMAALTRALERFRALGDKTGEAQAEGNLGLTHGQAGRRREALQAYRRAVILLQGVGDQHLLATARINVADSIQRGVAFDLRAVARIVDPARRKARRTKTLAALKLARALIHEVLPIAKAGGAEGMICIANFTLGEIQLTEGKLDEALALIERARDDASRLGAWRPHLRGTALLARVHLKKQDWRAAMREARAAAEQLRRSLTGLTEADLARARALTPDVFDVGITAALRAQSNRDLAYFLEAGRASALLSGLGGRATALRATVPEALTRRLTDSTRARLKAFTTWRASRTADFTEERRIWKQYQATRAAEQKALKDTQRAQAAAAERLAPTRLVSIRQIQARLGATARPGLRQVFLLFNFQSTEGVALLIEPSETRVVTYAARDLTALRKALTALIASDEEAPNPTVLASLKKHLIDPLEIPAGPTRLFICPDRALAYAPLSAVLPDDWEVVWEPSATTYVLLSGRGMRRGQHVLGLGDPDYGAVADPDALETRGGPRLTPLPATRLEIEAITRGPKDRRLLAGEATERAFREALEERKAFPWKSVHLACHGFVDVEWPALSCLAVTPGDGEDGLLTGSEILRLSMRTDLAVLSACQTGRGKFVRGEGAMSLTRAFMFAGASRVIVSLWNVDDKATAHLMQAFYRAWNAGRGTARALRLAQLAVRDHEVIETVSERGKPPRQVVRRPWAEPRYWAAWTLWGLPD